MTTVLLTIAAKTTIVLVVTLALVAAARRRSAAQRHWLLTVGLTSILLLPLLSGVWPSFLAAPLPAAAAATRPVMTTAATFDTSDAAVAATVRPGAPAVRRARPTPLAPWTFDGARVVLLVWAIGAVALLSRLGVGLWTLRRCARRATPIADGPWRWSCDAAAGRLGLTQPVRLVRGANATPLVTWGWRRPTILVPDDALGWSDDRRDLVLVHELAHVSRRDWAAQLVGEVVRALHWYHPLAWVANRRLRLDAEHAVDDRVVTGGVAGADYASHLLALARQSRRRTPWTPAPAIARSSSLEGRIRAMLDTSLDRTPLNRRSQLGVAAAALLALLPLAALTTAQAQFHSLSGTLVDATGRALPGVTVSLTNEATAAKYEVRSDATGRYEFVGLPPGSYSLAAATLGFQDRRETVSITGDRDLPLRLLVGTLTERVRVVSSLPTPSEDPGAAEQERARTAARATQAAERQARAVATCAADPPAATGGNILPPMKIRHVSPTYPTQARAAGLGGTVTLHAVIDTTGAVREARPVSAPSAELEAAAVEAVREWRFTPTWLNCDAIEVEMNVTVDFIAPKQ